MEPLDSLKISPEVAAVPKADLHLHAEAGPRLHRIFAQRRGEPTIDWAEWVRDVVSNVAPGLARLNYMSKTLISEEDDAPSSNFIARVSDVLEESANSGAIYAEVRFGRETIMRPDFMASFREAESAVAENYPTFFAEPLATLIPLRDPPKTERLVAACIDAAKDGLAGVDIIPDPYVTEAEWVQAYGWADRLAEAGLSLTVHAGEFSTANVAAALQAPGVRRIGHGIQVITDENLLEQVIAADVAMECCLTSNVILGAASSYETHPLPGLINAGLPVTINTDNPVRFRTDISREYEMASRIGITSAELMRTTRNSIEYAFTSSDRKEQLLKLVQSG